MTSEDLLRKAFEDKFGLSYEDLDDSCIIGATLEVLDTLIEVGEWDLAHKVAHDAALEYAEESPYYD